MSSYIKVFTDATAKGNPGPSGIGIVIKDDLDNIILTHKEYLGENTNNVGEYKALIKSVDLVKELDKNFSEIKFFLDSALVVNQINGSYKIKNKDLIMLSMEFWKKIKDLDKEFEISHIQRSENKLADKLANEAVNSQTAQYGLNSEADPGD
jgi:ribonuclease HI